MHPDLDRFVAAATARGLPSELSVNPSLLEPELGRRLLEAGLRRLVCSLDGMDDATSTAIRGPAASYEKAARNLDALLERVAQMKAPPVVVIQMLDLSRNAHQRTAFLARWGTTGLANVHAVVKDLGGDDPDLGRPTSTPTVFLCTYPWRSLTVLWDGRVVPCCHDDDGRLVLGDLKQQSLVEIWRGPKVAELRVRHRSGQLPAGHLCRDCGWRREKFAGAMRQRHPDRAREHPYQW
ncbi:MAG: SPASM domain-containing protein [Myxococcales bacterium]